MAEKLKKEDLVTIFLVHLHLDVVPEVLLMIGMNFLIHKSPILLSMIDLHRKKFLRSSLRSSLSSVTWMLFSRIPWWLERKVSFTKLVDNHLLEMPTKFQDDWFINSWEILTFRPLEKEKEKEKTSYRSFQIFNLET